MSQSDQSIITLCEDQTTNGRGAIARVINPRGQSHADKVQFLISGTVGATVQLVTGLQDTSPIVLEPTKGESGETVGTFTTTGSFMAEMVVGTIFSVDISNVSSASVTVQAMGPVELLA